MTTRHDTPASGPDRRGFLIAASALAVATRPLLAAVAAPLAKSPVLPGGFCTITPSSTEGPFYDPSTIQQNITGGKPGLPFFLFMKIVHASGCTEIPGAEVDVWHCDAEGLYSNVPAQGTAGQTWLRGTQITNNKGVVGFITIYPGLYPGRTAHFHIKVRPDATNELTAQLYFPDVVTSLVHQFVAPYNVSPPPQTLNANDGNFTPETVLNLAVLQTPLGLLGTLIIGLDD